MVFFTIRALTATAAFLLTQLLIAAVEIVFESCGDASPPAVHTSFAFTPAVHTILCAFAFAARRSVLQRSFRRIRTRDSLHFHVSIVFRID